MKERRFAAALLELVVEPSKGHIKETEDRLRALQVEGQKIINDQQFHVRNLEKARANAGKLAKEAEAAKVPFFFLFFILLYFYSFFLFLFFIMFNL